MSQSVPLFSISHVNHNPVLNLSSPNPRQTYSELIREHHRMALLYARTLSGDEHTSRDLAQDAFLVGWQNWAKFDITRDFPSWLRGIIRNKWREHCRKESRTSAWDDEALSALESTKSKNSLKTASSTNFKTASKNSPKPSPPPSSPTTTNTFPLRKPPKP